jgi:PAS domain S-box-containing protein
MRLKLKIWLILGLVMLGLSGLSVLLGYREIDRLALTQMHQQARYLRATLMATRRVYHKQFLASGLPLNDHTLGFLPAHAMSLIAQDSPNWSNSGLRFNNVSDRPRNPKNLADADELVAMAWFRAHPKEEEYVGRLREKNGREFFHFATPIWTEAYCLTCHNTQQSAPPTIRQRYDAGYGYKVGDLRGIMSVRIPMSVGREVGRANWLRELQQLGLLLLVLFTTLGLLLNRYVIDRLVQLRAATQGMARGDYRSRVNDAMADEIGDLARGFNAMAEVIEQREQVIKDSEQQYRILADYSANWEYWLGADGRYLYVSPSCESMSGYPPEDFMADPGLMERLLHLDDLAAWNDHFNSSEPVAQADSDGLVASPHTSMMLRIFDKAGELRWIEHVCVALYDGSGHYLGRRGSNRDISELKRAEEMEQFSAFQAGIAEMSTSVLHNIGNAITAVTQDAEMIDKTGGELVRVAQLLDDNASRTELQLADPAAVNADLARRHCAIQHEAARAIRNLAGEDLSGRSRRLGASVTHIADIVRIQQSAALPNGQQSSFSLSQAIQSALEMQGDAFTKRGIEVSVKVDPVLESVTLSHNLMLQTLVNVFRNSVEAIDERTQEESFQGRLQVDAELLDAGRMRLTVTDNGIGFHPDARDNLFRFGFSTKARGTGFGLPSVAMFAHEAGGKVTLESEGRGHGARLVLELPIHSKTKARQQ